MPIPYFRDYDDDRFISEHHAPGIQRLYRDDHDEQPLPVGTHMCEHQCGRTVADCTRLPCGGRIADEQPNPCPHCGR